MVNELAEAVLTVVCEDGVDGVLLELEVLLDEVGSDLGLEHDDGLQGLLVALLVVVALVVLLDHDDGTYSILID